MERMQTIFGHLSVPNRVQNSAFSSLAQKEVKGRFTESEDDVVIVSALRTPIGKAGRGSLKDTTPDDLLVSVLKATLERTNVNPTEIGDICVGNVLQPGAGPAVFRIAQFAAGIPETVPLSACNRQCSSGLQAVMHVANSIKAGVCDMGIGAGVESMSKRKQGGDAGDLNPDNFKYEKARDCIIPMGITSENVAERFGVTRETQDKFAAISQQRACAATEGGLFQDEIVPVKTKIVDKDGNEREITVTKDDGVRPGTTKEKLARLPPAFKKGGSTTAGNSSQVSDGAAAVLVARRSKASELGLPVFGVIRSYAVVGVPPDVMGIGPAYAIPEALKKAGLSVDDIDVFEVNEAFASQAVYSVDKLGIPWEKVNPNGGAIALGHPLGCTGSRQIATLLNELRRRGKRAYGVVSMCIGTGMGAAAVIEYPGPRA
ncbi:3-ketoacyl-CoA thiolase B, peroxisomal-like [Branchiostoma lanceolatum]|uniref:3-ketoacyl-CoA thiolase B, peroxisomal-like n=1 Tax=Branchiostoma lanceolatum TaxID=7740 RepID=UPI00345246D5